MAGSTSSTIHQVPQQPTLLWHVPRPCEALGGVPRSCAPAPHRRSTPVIPPRSRLIIRWHMVLVHHRAAAHIPAGRLVSRGQRSVGRRACCPFALVDRAPIQSALFGCARASARTRNASLVLGADDLGRRLCDGAFAHIVMLRWITARSQPSDSGSTFKASIGTLLTCLTPCNTGHPVARVVHQCSCLLALSCRRCQVSGNGACV